MKLIIIATLITLLTMTTGCLQQDSLQECKDKLIQEVYRTQNCYDELHELETQLEEIESTQYGKGTCETTVELYDHSITYKYKEKYKHECQQIGRNLSLETNKRYGSSSVKTIFNKTEVEP